MIKIKSKKEIRIMKRGGEILAKIMKVLEKKIKPGVSTKELEKHAEKLIFKFGSKPSFKGYEGFPSVICASINEELVHCPPSHKKLKSGEILSIDIGLNYQGFHLDMARTFPVEDVSFLAQRLIRITKKALKLGIKKAKIGNTIGDIGNTIQRYVEGQGFNVIRELFGHGIGEKIHEEPQIPNFGKRKKGDEILEGMTICIEPMVSVKNWKIEKTKDGFGFKTQDNSLSCHFEDTIAITKKGPLVLTK